jgi:hypothetical protein
MPASLIAGAFFAEGTFAYAATAFAIRLATTFAIASLLQKDQTVPQGTAGGELQLGPATDNKLPVAYGTTYVTPIVVDAILSSDQQTMWYVLAFSETTDTGDIHFEEVWYDGKLLLFDGNTGGNPNEILGWWTRPKKNSKIGGTIEQGPAGKVAMYFYKNGSLVTGTQHRAYDNSAGFNNITDNLQSTSIDAITLLQDSRIPDNLKWITNDKMSNSVFAVLRLNYDANNGVHGLGQIQAKIVNTLNAPGDVIQDYLTNARYGAGVDITYINTASLARINTISSESLSLVDTLGQSTSSAFTYQINGVVDTTQNCLSNLQAMTDACDSWLQWDERQAKWGVIPNISLFQSGATTATNTINSDQIIGGINLVPTDLKTSANKITIAFPNTDIINQVDYRYYWLEDKFLSPNEPENNIDVNMPFVNNSFQATYLGYRKLWMSREDLIINFTMDYSGIHLNAGDIIFIQHEWYGWGVGTYNGLTCPGKPFRITQIKESKDASGFLSVQISAMSYNDSIYYTMNPHFYTPDEFGLLTATNFISQPDAPIVSYVNSSTGIYWVQGNIPQYGNITGMEFWYSVTTSTLSANNYTLYSTQNYIDGSLYPHTATNNTTFFEQIELQGMTSNTYWWRTRAQGPNSTSDFSPASQPFQWTNTQTVVLGQQVLDSSISGSKVQPPASNSSAPSQGGFFSTLGPALALGAGALGASYLYKNGYLNDLLPKALQSSPSGGPPDPGNDSGIDPGIIAPTLTPKYQTAQGDPTDNPQPGDQQIIVADATPQPNINDYSNFDDYGVPSSDSGEAVA